MDGHAYDRVGATHWIEHDVMVESMARRFIEIGIRSLPSWSQNQPTTHNIL